MHVTDIYIITNRLKRHYKIRETRTRARNRVPKGRFRFSCRRRKIPPHTGDY